MAKFPSIPQEIIEENILTRLPVKSIQRFRCVCKHWCNNLFRNPSFIKLHLQHAIAMNRFNLLFSQDKWNQDNMLWSTGLYSIDHDVLSTVPSETSQFIGDAVEVEFPLRSDRDMNRIHCSCDGLVCVTRDYCDICCIWNPTTNEFKQLPKIQDEEESDDETAYKFRYKAYGLGYDHRIGDYKLIRIVYFDDNKHVLEVRVYTLGSNSWKNLGSIPYSLSGYHTSTLLVDGVLHWLAIAHHTEIQSRVVLSFDICNEKFCETPLPDKNRWIDHNLLKLGMWKGKLCLLLMCNKYEAVVWTMKDYTWSKQMNITEQILDDVLLKNPIQTFQNGEILFDSSLQKELWNTGLVTYDPKLESARVLKIHGLTDPLEMEPYIETLVSLNSGTFVGQE